MNAQGKTLGKRAKAKKPFRWTQLPRLTGFILFFMVIAMCLLARKIKLIIFDHPTEVMALALGILWTINMSKIMLFTMMYNVVSELAFWR